MHYIKVGDVLVTREQIQEGIACCDANKDSGPGVTFTYSMRKLNNPLADWSAGIEYKGLHHGARWPEIRVYWLGSWARRRRPAAASGATGSASSSSAPGLLCSATQPRGVRSCLVGWPVPRTHVAPRRRPGGGRQGER